MKGKEIGGYRFEKRIGRGGMGVIYRAVHGATGQTVAVKMLHPHLTRDPSVRDRFLREARAQARLSHPHITEIRSLLEEDGNYYIIMEFVEGETLAARLKRSGRLSPEEGLPIFRQVLDAVVHAHGVGVIHRDLKPSNVMILPNGFAKVTDFGTAKILDAESLTLSGTAVGSPLYMSPEQLRGEELSAASDVYALGITLYQMSTGAVPYEGDSLADLLRHLTADQPTGPCVHLPSIDPTLEAIILKAIAKEREERYETVEALREALDAYRKGSLADDPLEGVPGPEPVDASGPSGYGIIISVLLLTALVGMVLLGVLESFPIFLRLLAIFATFGFVLFLVFGYSPSTRDRAAALCPQCRRRLGEAGGSCSACGWSEASAPPQAHLVGKDPEGQDASWPLPAGTLTIGRKAPCQITLEDDQVSSRHAEIRRAEGQIRIVDLGSTNGTSVNGSRLKPDHPTSIYDGDRIVIGRTTFRLAVE